MSSRRSPFMSTWRVHTTARTAVLVRVVTNRDALEYVLESVPINYDQVPRCVLQYIFGIWYRSSEPSCSALLIWSQITVKWMITDDLDTSDMMKCHNKVNQELTRVSPISSATCTKFGLSCFRHPVNSCQKSPNQPWQGPVKVLKYHQLYQLLAHVPGKALSDAQSILAKSRWSAINQRYVILQLQK